MREETIGQRQRNAAAQVNVCVDGQYLLESQHDALGCRKSQHPVL
jgi:hypothetical protein